MIVPIAFILALGMVILWKSRPIIATITALQLFFVVHIAATFGRIRDEALAAGAPIDDIQSIALGIAVKNALYSVIILALIMAIIHVVKRIFTIRKESEARPQFSKED